MSCGIQDRVVPGKLVAVIDPQILQILCLLRGVLETSKKKDIVLDNMSATVLIYGSPSLI